MPAFPGGFSDLASVTAATKMLADSGSANGLASALQIATYLIQAGFPFDFSHGGSTRAAPANTSENILQTVTLPGGTMGANGRLFIVTHWNQTNNANVKTARVRLGGIGGTAFADVPITSSTNSHLLTEIWNQNSASSQRGGVPAANSAPFGTYGSASVTAAVNTASSVDLVITGQKATAGDTLELLFHSVLLFYGA